jgi:uncharacterized protein (TIGR02118 family)
MIRAAVLYPNSEGSRFDLEYYKRVHMPLVWKHLGPFGLLGCEVDGGIESADGGLQPFAAIGYMFFETAEAFDAAFDKGGDPLIADIPNYTNIEPVMQISSYERIDR